MSLVTSAVVLVDTLEGAPILNDLMTVVTPPSTTPQSLGKMDDFDDTNWIGGYKALQIDVFAAGLNYVNGKELEKWFYQLSWDEEDQAVLIYIVEDGEFIVKHKRRGLHSS